MKMKGKSPMMKALVGNQKNLNEGLKAAIKAAPGKMMAKTPSVMERMKTAMKVRGMGEDAVGKVRGMGEKSPNKIMKAKAAAKVMKEKAVAKVAKPDFPDIDGDGDRKESISKAAADKKVKSPAKGFVIAAKGKNKRQDKRFDNQRDRDAKLIKRNPEKAVKRGERLSKKADKQEARKAKGKKVDEGKLFQRKLRSNELKSAAKIKTMARGKRMVSNQKEGLATKTVQKKRKKQEPITSVKPKPIPSVAKKEGEKGKKIEYDKSTRKWDSPKDLQNATSMVMAKINKAMLPPSKAKELAAQAKKLLSIGAVGNLDNLMGRNKISGDFTSFKGFSITPKKKK